MTRSQSAGAAAAQRASFGVVQRLLESADAACATLGAKAEGKAAPAAAAAETPAKKKGKKAARGGADAAGGSGGGASASSAQDGWARVCDIVSGILLEMQQQGLYSGVVDPKHSALLSSHADALLAQAGRLAAADAAGPAPAAALRQVGRISDLSVALLLDRLPQLWPLVFWRAAAAADAAEDGGGDAGGDAEGFCLTVVRAHADKRVLPALVPAVTSALCGAAASADGSVACARHRGAARGAFSAWALPSVSGRLAAAVSAAPAAQATSLVSAVLDGLRQWEAGGLFSAAAQGADGSEEELALSLACSQGLAALFSAVLDNLNSALEGLGAVATVAEELTGYIEGLLQSLSAAQGKAKGKRAAAAAGGSSPQLPRSAEPAAALLCHVLHASQALLARCRLSTPNALAQPAPPETPAWEALERASFHPSQAGDAAPPRLPWLRLGVARLRIQHAHLEALAHPPPARSRAAAEGLRSALSRLVEASVAAPADGAGDGQQGEAGLWDGSASAVTEESLPVALRLALSESLSVWCASREELPPPCSKTSESHPLSDG